MRYGIFIENYRGYRIRYMNRQFFCWELNDEKSPVYFSFKYIDDLKNYIDLVCYG